VIHNPGRVAGDVAGAEYACDHAQSQKTVQDPEGERWNSEEIHCSYGFTMILEECHPAFCRFRILWRSLYPSRDSSFGDIESEL
jgi:hypothetical protein